MRSKSLFSRTCGAVTAIVFGSVAAAESAMAQFDVVTRRPTRDIEEYNSPVPRSRELLAFVYDSANDRLLLFGGTLRRPDSRTFALKDERWSVVSDSGPYYRDDMASAHMGSNGDIVFFGGHSEKREGTPPMPRQVVFRETWRFKENRWTLLDTTGPDARVHVGGAYDPLRKKFVVFGGTLGVGMSAPERVFATDTWEWDGKSWTRKSTGGPTGRMGFVMAYDAATQTVILHGGVRDNNALTDTWGWNGERWQQLSSDGPKTVYGAAATGPETGVIIFGGHRLKEPDSRDTWYWNGKFWNVVASSGPKARTFNALATDTRRKRVYLTGGADDLWYLDKSFTWAEISLPPP